jgi:hypothetical protein
MVIWGMVIMRYIVYIWFLMVLDGFGWVCAIIVLLDDVVLL